MPVYGATYLVFINYCEENICVIVYDDDSLPQTNHSKSNELNGDRIILVQGQSSFKFISQ
jgi:hypothetical protein